MESTSSQKILIVDDEPTNIRILNEILKNEYEIIISTSGENAVRIANDIIPDLILLDIIMPEMNGYEVCESIHANEATKNIPVIFITAKTEAEDESRGLKLGAIDYIAKPFIANVVKARVQNHLQLKKYRDDLEQMVKYKEEQLVHAEKLASIGQLVAGVAHEMNNPMGFVHSNLGTLKRYVSKLHQFYDDFKTIKQNCHNQTITDPKLIALKLGEIEKKSKIDFLLDESDEVINDCIEGIDRATGIIKNLKFFSHKGGGQFQDCDINQMIEKTIKFVWNELKYKTELVKNFGVIPKIKADEPQLSQVIMNLLVNGAHAIEKKGTIEVTTWEEDEHIYITIKDSGCGISKTNLAKIFDPFFTTKAAGKGTGLGLSISYDIIKMHNGEMEVQSETGIGTTFTIALPLRKKQNAIQNTPKQWS